MWARRSPKRQIPSELCPQIGLRTTKGSSRTKAWASLLRGERSHQNSGKLNNPSQHSRKRKEKHELRRVLGRIKRSKSTSSGSLSGSIDRFNCRMQWLYPNHVQPPLTKDELIAYASWNMERDKKLPAKCMAGLTKIAKEHQLPQNWTLDGFYGDTSNGSDTVAVFQISLQTDDDPAMQMLIRRRFLSPTKDYSHSTATRSRWYPPCLRC